MSPATSFCVSLVFLEIMAHCPLSDLALHSEPGCEEASQRYGGERSYFPLQHSLLESATVWLSADSAAGTRSSEEHLHYGSQRQSIGHL